MDHRWARRLRSALPGVLTATLVLVIAVVLAAVVAQREKDSRSEAFDRDADAAVAKIEREIERHLDALDDVAVFADATWPGDLGEWRRFLEGRMTSGSYLAYTSSAGLVEKFSVEELDGLVEREAAAGWPIDIREIVPLADDQDRLILTRTTDDDETLRGLELSVAAQLLGLDLPGTEERILVAVIADAPVVVFETLNIDIADFNDDDVAGNDIVFVQAVGAPGAEALGWIVAPANLAYLLDQAIEGAEGDLSIVIDAAGSESEGALARYSGVDDLSFEDASLAREQTLLIGEWEWTVDVWSSDGDPSAVGTAELILFAGVVLSVAMGVLVELRRRHKLGLDEARFELSLQRSLAETDHLTGLLNRQALATARQSIIARGSVFFADLDGFKGINDTLGHAAGDEALVAVARAMRTVARKEDLLVRLGGDEFLLVCPGVVDQAIVNRRASEVRRAIAAVEAAVPLRASVGSATAQHSIADELDALLDQADKSMYRDKHSHGVGAGGGSSLDGPT